MNKPGKHEILNQICTGGFGTLFKPRNTSWQKGQLVKNG